MVANKTSFWCMLFQAAVGTSTITAAGTTPTYYFGEYVEAQKEFTPPSLKIPISEYFVYASREGSKTKLDEKHENFINEYCPIDATFLGRFLGKCTDADPVTMEALDEGMKYPITTRHQKDGGTEPQNKQAVDSYTVGIVMVAEYDEEFKVSEEFAFGFLEDIADNDNLTTLPLAAGGCNESGTYYGKPYCTWNTTHRPEIVRCQIQAKQKHQKVHDPATGKDTVKLYEYHDKMAIVNGIFETEADSNIMWEDFIAGTARTFKQKVWKPDMATYIEVSFANCLITDWKETGIRDEGHYEAQVTISLGAFTVAANESGTGDGITFANFYKAAAL